ncbi:hypothetical protein ACFY05_33045 [Microtetraspora fusca]|uniref:Uncharacterized protein n=1 Tax=Microtetraspora fusca TaxID=1997 RepID=A0ABW6VFG5_MICFU
MADLGNFATAPVPDVLFTNHTASLVGVRYQHYDQCSRCGTTVSLYTDDGAIILSLDVSCSGKTVLWSCVHDMPRPVIPEHCPNCRAGAWAYHNAFTHRDPTYVGNGVSDALADAYSHLRATYPACAQLADKAVHLGRSRTSYVRRPYAGTAG